MSFHKFSELPFLMNLVFAPETLAMLHQDWQEHQIWFAAPQTFSPRFKLTPHLWLGCTKSGAG